MNFKNVPISCQPAYTWLWNTRITKEGIKARIDEMYESGIRAFYIIGEPENFRPTIRKTHLWPEYLSPEYIELVYYAYEVACEKGMYTWLYNEGGFPSGMACGKICELRPDLCQKILLSRRICLSAGERYNPDKNAISAFYNDTRITAGEGFEHDARITEYYYSDNSEKKIQSDNASRESTYLFIELTHERLKARFGDKMGSDVKLMFDDEAFMGTWTPDLEKIFLKKYGYDIADYMPYIASEKEPQAEAQYRAKSDYIMLCGELVRDNYFIPMREWLNKNSMYSTGHIDNDHIPNGNVTNRYGNAMSVLREFDIPGVDVIWSQISYPDENSEFNGMRFFPRLASSAARQNGVSTAVSESLAVFGAHVDPELMRYVVNAQAVRGISLFNFMVMSYDRKTPMMHQYRPNFVKENVGVDRLHEINDYTARLSYILSSSKAEIKTALYYPARSIAAGGVLGSLAAASFTSIGHKLEGEGIAFDIVDEDLILNGNIENGALALQNVRYESVIMPRCDFEIPEVVLRVSLLGKKTEPCIKRESNDILSRKVVFENGDEGYLIVNLANEKTVDTISIATDKRLYKLDLFDGNIYSFDCEYNGESATASISLLRGEALFILASNRSIDTAFEPKLMLVTEISKFTSFVSRRQLITVERGTCNEFYDSGEMREGLYEWDKNFSGEVTYIAQLPSLEKGEYLLEFSEVRSTAKIYIDGVCAGITTMPPYSVKFKVEESANELRVVVANTPANECARTDYFDRMDRRDVGGYHEKMHIKEALYSRGGGLFGPVKLFRIKQ